MEARISYGRCTGSSTGLDFNPDGIEFANGARWLPEQRRIYLHGVGQVKVHVHHQVQGRVKTIQINRQGRHWMLVLPVTTWRPIRYRRPVHGPVLMWGSCATRPSATEQVWTIRPGLARSRQ